MNWSKPLTALVLLGFLSTGCATYSPLRIPASNGPLRQFPPAPAAIVRLPVVITLPTTQSFGKDLSELVHGNLKNGIPDLAHWTSAMGAETALKLMRWNVSGGRVLMSFNMDWLKSISKHPAAPTTPNNAPVTEPQFPLQWSKEWHLEVVPVVEQTKEIGHQINSALKGAQDRYDEIQMKELNLVLGGFSNLLPKATDIWGFMQNPVYIDKGVWLLINPEKIGTGVITPDPKKPYQFNTMLEMTAHPTLYFGDHPVEARKPLPPLQVSQVKSSGFSAISNVIVDFTEVDRFLNDPHTGLINRVIPHTGGHKLKIRKVHLYGAAGKVIIETHLDYDPLLVNLTGKPAHMVIYFRGTPKYNLKNQTITMRDLDFDVKTNDFLVQVAEWIAKSDIRKELRRKARFPIGPVMKRLKDRMNVVLNCPVGTLGRLHTNVKGFKVLEAFVERDGLNARIALNGDAELDVKW